VFTLAASQLLDAWERGLSQSPLERALSLLDATTEEERRGGLSHLSIGQRDARLLALREQVFGTQLRAFARCPKCEEGVELSFKTDDVRAHAEGKTQSVLSIDEAGYQVKFRLPQNRDLATLKPDADVDENRRKLLCVCVFDARCGNEEVDAADLPSKIVAEISAKMAEADPHEDIEFALTCPRCSQHWQAPLDIAAFLWAELNEWAVRLLRDVHVLASVYGWREPDILALSPARRRLYLEMIGE
jgi:hypothetical protein